MHFLIKLCAFALLCFNFNSVTGRPHQDAPNCGYDTCHPIKQDAINVHIVPHTHDDVGWLKTVDQYYYGSKSSIQKAGVEYILDSVIGALQKDPNRRFIYVETAFFWKWWIKQHDFVKSQVRKFVKNGQLEFIGGGWSMNDEACTHYQSTIDQFTWGLRKLNETFGPCGRPRVGWQIDPFGHSREMASLFAQMGYDGLLLGRIDYQDKEFRFKSRTPEMIWRGSPDNLGQKADLFTSVMYNTYSPPPGFCFDVLCDDEPIIDDKKSPDYNVDKRVQQFFEYVRNATKAYAGNNIIITMGEDFNYQDANMWFKNLDKLIKYANAQSNETNINLLYSTPSCYLKAVSDDAKKNKISFQTKSDDFFPYASDPTAYWSGYFTSKPAIKRFERIGNNYMQICKQLHTLTDLGPEDWVDLNVMREAMGVMQHHDAITGTEKDHVAQDYARLLTHGFDECHIVTSTALSKLISGKKQRQPRNFAEPPQPDIQFNSCMLANITQCEFTENQESFIVTVYNPLSRKVNQYVRLPITSKGLDVLDPNGKKVVVQIIPAHNAIHNIPGRQSTAKFEAVFEAEDIPALGFKSYFAKISNKDMVTKESISNSLKTANIEIKIDKVSGKVNEIVMQGKSTPFKNDFFYYPSAVGDNTKFEKRSSGAYIFRANGTLRTVANEVQNALYDGPLITELHQTFNEWVSQVVRLYRDENAVEFQWLIGPIPIEDQIGKEVITRYTTDLQSEKTFYTDSNGREMLKRVRNFRPSWKLNLTEPVPGNYYPVTSKILIRDPTNDVEVAVLNDRSQGGSSLNDGEIELMLHRRCLHDDAFGVGEALNETQFGKGLVVRGSHYVAIGSYIHKHDLAQYEKDLAQRKLIEAWTFISSTNNLKFEDYQKKYTMQYSAVTKDLPPQVKILTLEPWQARTILLRLENVMEKTEGETQTVNLKSLFKPFKVTSFKRTMLAANQWSTNKRNLVFQENSHKNSEDFVDAYTSYDDTTIEQEYNWNKGYKLYKKDQFESNDIKAPRRKHSYKYLVSDDEFDITLEPMEIATFIIETDMI